MPTALAVSLVVLMVAALVWTRRSAQRGAVFSRGEAALGVIGSLGLVAHCSAMFYSEPFLGTLGGVPGVRAYVDAVNAMGSASIVAYAVPAALVLIAARRRPPHAVVVLAALLAVGVTMYDGGPLPVHLAAITLLVVVLAWLVSPLTSRLSVAT